MDEPSLGLRGGWNYTLERAINATLSLSGHHREVLTLERIEQSEVKSVFKSPDCRDAVERLQAEGENFNWFRVRKNRVVGGAYLILRCKETTWLRGTMHGFEVELKMR